MAESVRKAVKTLGSGVSRTDIEQVVRSSGSVAANYIEANSSLGKKDFVMRLRICLKEAKETGLWLRIIESGLPVASDEIARLRDEAEQLRNIFGAAIRTLERQSVRNAH